MATQGKQRPVRIGSTDWTSGVSQRRERFRGSAKIVAAYLQRIEFDLQKEKMMATPGFFRVCTIDDEGVSIQSENVLLRGSLDRMAECLRGHYIWALSKSDEDRCRIAEVADAALRALAE